MGGSSSKAKSTIIAEAVNEAMVNSMQTCTSNVDLEQSINVKGQGNVLSNIQMNQVYSSVMTCVNNTSWMSKFQNDLSAAIKQSAESQSVALLGALGNSDTEVENYIKNSVRNSVNVSTMTQLINNIKQKQTINVQGVGNTLINISMSQMNNNISSSTQELVGSMDVINRIAAVADQKAKSTQQDPIANLLSGLANLLTGPLMWVAIMLIGGLVIFVIFLNTGAGQAIMDKGFDYADGYAASQGYGSAEMQYQEPGPELSVMEPPEPAQEPMPAPTRSAPTSASTLGESSASAPAYTQPPAGPINMFDNQNLPYEPPKFEDVKSSTFNPTPGFNPSFSPDSNPGSNTAKFTPVVFEESSASAPTEPVTIEQATIDTTSSEKNNERTGETSLF
jgi:hypothetical protein